MVSAPKGIEFVGGSYDGLRLDLSDVARCCDPANMGGKWRFKMVVPRPLFERLRAGELSFEQAINESGGMVEHYDYADMGADGFLQVKPPHMLPRPWEREGASG
jgi:hypothetical protein